MKQKKVKIDLNGKTILITGGAGFIGSNLIIRLLKEMKSGTIVNIDNMNNFYSKKLKEYRAELVEKAAKSSGANYVFIKGNIADNNLLRNTFTNYKPSIVVNLAAQAGTGYSTDHTDANLESNIIGFYGILQSCRFSYGNGHAGVQHLVYASSSSVYGESKDVPFKVDDKADRPVSLYGASKRADELLAHSYSKLYNMPATGLRLFSVYGPGGRPDMFYYSATDKLANDQKIDLYNYGNCKRDLTYIDDVVEGIYRVMQEAPAREDGEDGLPVAPYSIYNLGSGVALDQQDFVNCLEEELVNAGIVPADFDFEGHKNFIGMQAGDVAVSYGDITGLEEDFDFKPSTDLKTGLGEFAKWYKEYYK
ncbi:MAG: NAD-dependent epimerase/dehydratase family protein [Eubacterium sp.]|nr:NAD-dependent epimerase/dehydratase family protein [Eubacterium sp.]